MISCSQYDYIEIVCMYRYPIKLTMQSDEVIEGVALDTQRNGDGEECIKIEFSGAEHLFVLDNISKLEVTVENPHFQDISFD